jgi:hypothetical protein
VHARKYCSVSTMTSGQRSYAYRLAGIKGLFSRILLY